MSQPAKISPRDRNNENKYLRSQLCPKGVTSLFMAQLLFLTAKKSQKVRRFMWTQLWETGETVSFIVFNTQPIFNVIFLVILL